MPRMSTTVVAPSTIMAWLATVIVHVLNIFGSRGENEQLLAKSWHSTQHIIILAWKNLGFAAASGAHKQNN